MCFYITIAVPAQDAGLVAQVFNRELQIEPSSNAAIMAALPAGYAAALVTNGVCSCGLYGSLRRSSSDAAERLRHKYAKRGWSEAKIARAVAQASSAGSKGLHPRGLHPDVVTGLQKLCEEAGEVAVVVHWYGGLVESERFALSHAEPCECG